MPSLNAMFRLYDKYSTTADKVIGKTDQATDKILKASGATDKFNDKLEATGASASSASSGLGKFLSIAALIAGTVKGMGIADEYTNTAARLDLINDGLQTQAELQDKIFAAADRAKGSYSDMANAVAKLGLLAGDAFSSNDEAIAFTELVQKSFKISGADTSEQQGAMRQLSQAMASGRLQGDELVSIMENAPMLYNAIAKYTGLSKGELKELGSDGGISADMIKNSLFMAANDIETKFSELPMTFADYWKKIKNEALRAFGPLIKRVNKIINTEKFGKFIDKIVAGLNIAANAADKALDALTAMYDFIENNWDDLVAIVGAATAAWLTYRAALLLIEAIQWAANLSSMINPIGLTIVLVVVLAAAFVLLWEKCEQFRKTYTAMWKSSAKVTVNGYNSMAASLNALGLGWNSTMEIIKIFVRVLRVGMIAAVRIMEKAVTGMIDLFSPLIETIGLVIDAYNAIARVTGGETIGFDVSTESLKKLTAYASDKAVTAINASTKVFDSVLDNAKVDKLIPLMDPKGTFDKIDALGDTIEKFTVSGWIKDMFSEASGMLDSLLDDKDDRGGSSYYDPTVIVGTGSNGKVKVDMSSEDLKYLRDIAEREYINKFSTATLAPNVQITFGDVHETADADKLHGKISEILREEIATAAEGV